MTFRHSNGQDTKKYTHLYDEAPHFDDVMLRVSKPQSPSIIASIDDVKMKEDRELVMYKSLKTGLLGLVFISHGVLCMIGTTLPDFLNRININNEEYGRLKMWENIVSGTVGLLVGSMLDRFQEQTDFLISLFLFIYGISQILLPLCTYQYFALVLMISLNLSAFITGSLGTSYVIAMWGEQASMPVHCLYLGFPLGCTLAPLLARPYLSEHGTEDAGVSVDKAAVQDNVVNLSFDKDSGIHENIVHEDTSRIEVPFAISGTFTLLCGLCFGAFYFNLIRKPHNFQIERKAHTSFRDVCNPHLWAAGKPGFGVLIFVTIIIFFSLLHAIEGPLTNLFLFTYAVKGQYKLSSSDAAYLDSSFKASMFVGRVVALPLSHYCPMQVMIFIELIGSLICAICLATLGTSTVTYFRVFLCLMNFMLAPLWPGGFAWAHRYIIIYTSMLAISDTFLRVSDGVFSWLCGYILEYRDPNDMWTVLCVLFVIILLVVTIAQFAACRHGERFTTMDRDCDVTDTTTLALLDAITEEDEDYDMRPPIY